MKRKNKIRISAIRRKQLHGARESIHRVTAVGRVRQSWVYPVVMILCIAIPVPLLFAVPPMPFRLGGQVVIDNLLLTQANDAALSILVSDGAGAVFEPTAQDTDGLNEHGWYVIDIPIYEPVDQPGGATVGDNATIHIFYADTELTVISPSGGRITIGESGQPLRIDLQAVSDDGNAIVGDIPMTVPGGEGDSGLAPPVPIAPENEATQVPITLTLRVAPYGGEGTHMETHWQVSREPSFDPLTLDVRSARHLIELRIPELMLTGNTTYFWRYKMYNEANVSTAWSRVFSFKTRSTNDDLDANGILDNQEVDRQVDLDTDGTPDIYQRGMKSVATVMGNQTVGVKASNHVDDILAVQSLNPQPFGNLEGQFVPGVIGFKAATVHPGDVAGVVVYFSLPLPDDALWYSFSIPSGWQENFSYATISDDRSYVYLEIRDGGFGDVDGAQNGSVVSIGGLVRIDSIGIAQEPAEVRVPVPVKTGSNGGGCFIRSLEP